MKYSFAEYELDTDLFELRFAGEPCKIEPQVFSLLELLVSNHTRLVSKDEINMHVWGGRVVSEAVVNSRIKAARKAIGDNGKAQERIRTHHGRGFRFIAKVTTQSAIPKSQSSVPEKTDEAAGSAKIATDGRPSIAVLPLQVLTPDERYGALGDAVSQEVIIELSRLHWLIVIARGSSFRFREPDADMTSIGKILGARYLVSGTISFAGRTSAVTVELSNTSDGQVLWTDRIECPVDDLLQLRFTLSSHIVTVIESRIQLAEASKAAQIPTENLDAWSAYHRGLWHMYRFNQHDNSIAARLFDRALTADGNFARAHAGLSFTHFQNAFLNYTGDKQQQKTMARHHAEKSIELDPYDPFTNLTMGRCQWIHGDIEAGMPWLDRSVDLSPNYAFAIYNRGVLNMLLGHGQQSEDNTAKAISLSPIDPLNYAMLTTRSLSHFVRADYQTAVEWADRAIRAPNAHVHIHVIAALAHEKAGNHQRAVECVQRVRNSSRNYQQSDFFNGFSFRDDVTMDIAKKTLNQLNL